MVIGKADVIVIERARTALADAMTPLLAVLSRPAASVGDAIRTVRELRDLRGENARLREDNERLLQWQQAARRLQAENQALRALAAYVPEPRARFVTARVVAGAGGPFVRSVLVLAGVNDGVAKGQAAMTGAGLAGRVAEAGEQHARILLVTDLNSRIPVVVERTRDRAVAAGENSDIGRLIYLDPAAQVEVGDRVVTSGHGGGLPAGLPVADVVAVEEGGVRIRFLVDWSHLEYLRLVDYRVDGVVLPPPPQAPAGRR
ncbi:MAG: rod shape-determining protein MreC [Thalassobaculales bacterium]